MADFDLDVLASIDQRAYSLQSKVIGYERKLKEAEKSLQEHLVKKWGNLGLLVAEHVSRQGLEAPPQSVKAQRAWAEDLVLDAVFGAIFVQALGDAAPEDPEEVKALIAHIVGDWLGMRAQASGAEVASAGLSMGTPM